MKCFHFALGLLTCYFLSPFISASAATSSSDFSISAYSQVNEEEVLGDLNLFVPLVSSGSSGNTLFYFNPSASSTSRSQAEGGLGLGVRHLAGPILAGANVFGDFAESARGSQRYQFGAGAELLTDWGGLRANYYAPESGRDAIDEFTATTSSREVSQSATLSSIYGGEMFGSIHSVWQRQMVNRIETTRIVDTTTSQLFRRYESAMEGYDLRGELQIPGLAESVLYGGYRHYDDPFAGELEGAFGGVEFALLRGISFEVEYHENDYFTGGQWNFGLQARAQFGGGHDWRDMFQRPVKKELPEKLYGEVRRSRRMQFAQSDFEEEVSQRRIATKTKVKRRVIPVEVGVVEIEDKLIVVDPGAPKDNQFDPGTFENPLDTIQQGADMAVGLNGNDNVEANLYKVYVWAENPAFIEDVAVTDGNVVFKGSSQLIHGSNNQFFGTPGLNPLVQNGGFNFDGSMSDNFIAVRGFTITGGLNNGTQQGIDALNINHIVLEHNIFENTTFQGARIVSDLDDVLFDVDVRSNEFRDYGDFQNNIEFEYSPLTILSENQAQIDVEVSFNSFRNIYTDFDFARAVLVGSSDTSSASAVVISGNTFEKVRNGMMVNATATATIFSPQITNNQFSNPTDGVDLYRGIFVQGNDGAVNEFAISHNHFQGKIAGTAIGVNNVTGASTATGSISQNIIEMADVAAPPVGIFLSNNGLMDVDILGNKLFCADPNAIGIQLLDIANTMNTFLTADLVGNEITGGEQGIRVGTVNPMETTIVSVIGNTIRGTGDLPLERGFVALANNGALLLDLAIEGNTIESVGVDGAFFETVNLGAIEVTINANTITNSGDDAFAFYTPAGTITVSGGMNPEDENTTTGSGSGLANHIEFGFGTSGMMFLNGDMAADVSMDIAE